MRPPDLLAEHSAEILACKGLDKDCVNLIETRIDLLRVDVETCWQELELLCSQATQDRADPETDYGYALVEAIARHGETDRVLSALAVRADDLDDHGVAWRELFMASLAGEMRLDAAVAEFVGRLRECDQYDDLMFEEVEEALVKIGTDAAVEGAAALFSHADWFRRLNACHALEYIHCDLAVSKALELLPREGDSTVRAHLARAPISQLAYEGVEPVRQLILGGNYDVTYTDLRADLVTATTLMGVDLPEREQWLIDIQQGRQEREG